MKRSSKPSTKMKPWTMEAVINSAGECIGVTRATAPIDIDTLYTGERIVEVEVREVRSSTRKASSPKLKKERKSK